MAGLLPRFGLVGALFLGMSSPAHAQDGGYGSDPSTVGGDVRSSSDNGQKEIILVVGGQDVITTSYSVGDISLGNSRTVGLTPIREKRELILLGRQQGSTSLILWDTRGVRRDEYYIRVIPESLQRLKQSVESLLSDIEGVKVRVLGDKILVEGEVFLEDEMRRVKNVADKNPNVINMVTLSAVTQRILASTVEKEIGRPEISVRPVRDKLILEGVVYSDVEKVRAEAIATAYYANIVNVLEVRSSDRAPGRGKTIVIIAHYVSLSKSLLNTWGLEWAPLALASGAVNGQGSLADVQLGATLNLDADPATWVVDNPVATSTASLIVPRIRRAKSSGYARVLENPTVSVKSGEEVVTFAGIQYPYPVYYQGGVAIEWKDIGIKLTATPFAQGDSVDMRLKIEVTELGQVSNSNGDPAINTARIETTQYCKSGESIVIGGLHRLADSVLYNRAPSDVPGAMFMVFKSKDYNKSKSQFLVFITPQIHETSTTANKEIQEKFNLKEVKQ